MKQRIIPRNNLEKAVLFGYGKRIVEAVAEEEKLEQAGLLVYLENERLSDEVIFFVLCFALSDRLLYILEETTCDARLERLIAEVRSPLPDQADEDEKKLITAILAADDNRIISLIREGKCYFKGFSRELLQCLPDLSLKSLLELMQNGLSARLKALLTGVLLAEVERPSIFQSLSYGERVKYANLMLHILQGEIFYPGREIFPANSRGEFSYYFDPLHRFAPVG